MPSLLHSRGLLAGVGSAASLIAAAFASLVFVTTYSFLWLADVVPMQFELLSPVMVGFWMAGLGVALWRYR